MTAGRLAPCWSAAGGGCSSRAEVRALQLDRHGKVSVGSRERPRGLAGSAVRRGGKAPCAGNVLGTGEAPLGLCPAPDTSVPTDLEVLECAQRKATELVKNLKGSSHKEPLRKDLITLYNFLKGSCSQMGGGVFSQDKGT